MPASFGKWQTWNIDLATTAQTSNFTTLTDNDGINFIDGVGWAKQGMIFVKTTDQTLAASDEFDLSVFTGITYAEDTRRVWGMAQMHWANGATATGRDNGETGEWTYLAHLPMSNQDPILTSATLDDDETRDVPLGDFLYFVGTFTDANSSASMSLTITVELKA